MRRGSGPELLVQPVSQHAGPAGDEGSEESSLHHMLSVFVSNLRRRWKLIGLCWVAFLIPVATYAVTAVPTYTARGAIQVSDGGGMMGANPLAELMGGGSQAEVQTEVEIMKRREFLVQSLNALKLQVVDREQDKVVTLTSEVALGGESPVDERLRDIRRHLVEASVDAARFAPVPVRLTALAADKLRADIGEPEESVEFAIGDRISVAGVALEFSEPPLAEGDSLTLNLLPEGALLEEYDERISVTGLGSSREPTNIVQVSVTDTDRETAQAIVQTMLERYLEKNLEWQSKSASQTAEFIEGQLEEVRVSLTESEEELKEYSESENAVQLDTQAKVAIENAAELEAQRVSVQLQEKTISSVLSRIGSGRSAKASVTANFFEDPVLAASIQALTEAETKYETMKASLTPEHPQVQELGRALEYQKREVARLMKSARKNLSHQKAQLEEALAASMEEMNDYPDKQLEIARLTRDMEVSQRLYTLLLEKHEEAEIMKASTTTDKRIVDAASLPHRKTSPKRGKLLAFGAFGGLLLGIGAAFTAHLLQSRLDTVEAVREVAPFPTYGTVPLIPGADQDEHRLSVTEVWAKPNDPAPEAFRALGVSVSLLPTDSDHGRLIMVTSSQPGEGKSTIASNLAVALSRTGKRVLIMDLDLRKPVQHRVWGVPRAPGYSDLVGQAGTAADLAKVAHGADSEVGATVLTAGTRMPDTVAAIMAPTLAEMLAAWQQEYDYVIIDSPPAFVAETTALARLADLVMLVARPGTIERSNLRHAIESLDRAGVPRGLVLNAVGRQHTEYYYGSGSGYYYYGSKYDEDTGKDGTAGDSGSHKVAS